MSDHTTPEAGLPEAVEEVVDIVLTYQGQGAGGPHDAVREVFERVLAARAASHADDLARARADALREAAGVVRYHARCRVDPLEPTRVVCACGADTDDHAQHVARQIDARADREALGGGERG